MQGKFRLSIPAGRADEPIIYKIVAQYNLKVNILEASLGFGKQGEVTVQLTGKPVDLEKGLLYLKEMDVIVEEIKD